jgi:hypothetical protein
MRELNVNELNRVAGGGDQCTPENSGNNIAGVTDPGSLGADLINVYEGLVAATSYIIERVANAFK